MSWSLAQSPHALPVWLIIFSSLLLLSQQTSSARGSLLLGNCTECMIRTLISNLSPERLTAPINCSPAGIDSYTATPHAKLIFTVKWNIWFTRSCASLLFNQPIVKLQLQRILLNSRPNFRPSKWVYFGIWRGFCFHLLQIWLQTLLEMCNFVNLVLSNRPRLQIKVTLVRLQDMIKGFTKISFMSALLGNNTYNDGGVATRFHHYDGFKSVWDAPMFWLMIWKRIGGGKVSKQESAFS